MIFHILSLVWYTFSAQALTNPHGYDQQFHGISQKLKQPVGIVVVAFNRPEYFSEMLAAVQQNPESKNLPFFFMLDGGSRAKQAENTALIEQSAIPQQFIIPRNRNYGCAKNLIDARRFMFDWCGFEKVIVLEDDLIISPHYIKLLMNLHSWSQKNFDNVGVAQCWSYCSLSRQEKEKKLSHVTESGKYWWSFVSYCLDKKAWNAIKPILYEFEKRFIDTVPNGEAYDRERSKPGISSRAGEIRAWTRNLAQTKKPQHFGKHSYKTRYDYASRFSRDIFQPNQDAMTAFSLWMANLIKVKTVVNRAKHIGKVGITADEELFNEKQGKIVLDIFNQDAAIKNFEVIHVKK